MTASANPHCRLAQRTSSRQCLPSMQNGFITEFNGIPERLDRRTFTQLRPACHRLRRPWQPPKALNQSRDGIQYP